MKRGRGFTLLELLIGLALLGFLLALLFGGFHLASTTWDTVSVHSERTADEQIVGSFLRRLTEQLQPMRWKKAEGQPITFIGQGQFLRGISSISGQTGSGLRVIELAAEPDGSDGRLRLVLRHAPLRYDADQFDDGLADPATHPLLDNLDAVEFSYFGAIEVGEASSWRDSWADLTHLPKLVRIRLGSHDGHWSELIVQPMVGSSGCLWDDANGQCK